MRAGNMASLWERPFWLRAIFGGGVTWNPADVVLCDCGLKAGVV